MSQVIVYTARPCSYCGAAKRLLESRGVAFEEVDVSHDRDKRIWLAEVTGQRTVPQVFIGGQPYGGYQELLALQRSGELDRLLNPG